MSAFKYYVAILSLVDAEGNPTETLLATYLPWLKENGVDGILVTGSTGEFPNMSVAQRQQYLECVLEHNPGLEVMVQIGASNLPETKLLQTHAVAQTGVSHVLWMPPFYYDDANVNGYTEATQELLGNQPEHIPFFLYHLPKFSQVHITAEWLNQFPQLAGIKDSSNDCQRISALKAACPDKQIFMGTDYRASDAVKMGLTGLISGIGSVFPKTMYEAIHNTSENETLLKSLRDTMSRYSKLPAYKAYLNHLNLCPENTVPLPPFRALTTAEETALITEMNTLLGHKETPHAHSTP